MTDSSLSNPSQPTDRARVCVVDDDPLVLAAITPVLEDEFDVLVARSGLDAVRLVTRARPDLVLLDVQMPGLDGFEVCRRLKADPATANVPVVFLTAQSDEDTEVRGLTAGGDDFISKPPRPAVMMARVRNLVRMKTLADRLQHEARSDGLTGLANRRFFVDSLGGELPRARRNRQPLSVLMLDVDHFKAFNDHHGHLAGDAVLARIGRMLGDLAQRPGDLAGRLGGEEFALLLPDTPLDGALVVADRIAAALAAANLPHGASPTAPRVTVSIGVAASCVGPPGAPRDGVETAEAVLSRADDALYAAKRAGRNRACAADGLPQAHGANA